MPFYSKRDGNETTFTVEDAIIVRHLERSMLVDADIFDDRQVIPYSQIHDDSELWKESDEGERGNLVVKRWLAKKKGWV